MNKEQIIEEAKKLGIAPGALVQFKEYEPFTVPEHDKWHLFGDSSVGWLKGAPHDHCYLYDRSGFYTPKVLTPAPSNESLVDGMACEPDEHMRAAIIAKAKDLDMTDGEGYDPGSILVYRKDGRWKLKQNPIGDYKVIAPGEFYDRLCRMPKVEPPIMIDSHEVRFFEGGDIKVGCTFVDFATLEKVYNKALSMR